MLMGGAVQGLLINRSRNVAGVSLFAAHMPGTSQKDLLPPDLPVPHTSMSCSDVIHAFGLIHFVHILSLPQAAGLHARSGEQQHVVPEVLVHIYCWQMHRLDACLCLACPAAAQIIVSAVRLTSTAKQQILVSSTKMLRINCRALSIAGVELMPFHVKGPSLPELTPGQWDSLVQSSHAASSSANNVAAVLLSEPHFVQVQSILMGCMHCSQKTFPATALHAADQCLPYSGAELTA